MTNDAPVSERQISAPAEKKSASGLVRSVYGNPGDDSNGYFQKNHPRRAAVLNGGENLLSELRFDDGELGGNYKSIMNQIWQVRSTEQTEAKAHGAITVSEKNQLLQDESKIQNELTTDHAAAEKTKSHHGGGDGQGKGGGTSSGGGDGSGSGDGGGDGGDGGGSGTGGGDGGDGGGSGTGTGTKSAPGDALQNVIDQNTRGKQTAYPDGVPHNYSWYKGTFTGSGSKPPEGYSSMTAWGIIYPEQGSKVDSNAKVDIQGMTTWAHDKETGKWVQIQMPDEGLKGAHYALDFKGNQHIPWQEQKLSSGGVQVDAPYGDYNDHFFLNRKNFNPSDYDGYYVTADIKSTSANPGLVASIGADWWKDATAKYPNNHAMGGSNFVALTNQWQSVSYTTMTAQELKEDPPPGL